MAKRRAPAEAPSLLESAAARGRLDGPKAPLADRMRPRTLAEVLGQRHLLGEGRFLSRAIAEDRVPSLILWGPPGSGKTTLANVVAGLTRAEFVPFNAVLGGVAELREIVAAAKERRAYEGRRTLLFVDEIHRFNKSQQDAFLPHVENGTVTLIGATTENPSFSVNAAVLSRARVFRLEALDDDAVVGLLRRALDDVERGCGARGLTADDDALRLLARSARGDARRALGLLESVVDALPATQTTFDVAAIERSVDAGALLYDKSGDEHYNLSSALIKSMRASDPDAAIYYLMRMLDAGEDPMFLLRRLVIFASEDVGNADPRAISVAVDADAAFRRLGMPEGLYPLAHACLYLACCPKSGAVGRAFTAARAAIEQHGALPVPLHLRNTVSALARESGWGAGYTSPHEGGPSGTAASCLPASLRGARFYEPTDEGLEKSIRERLARLRSGR